MSEIRKLMRMQQRAQQAKPIPAQPSELTPAQLQGAGQVVSASIEGPITLNYPLDIFTPNGALGARLHRHSFVVEMLRVYDQFYDQVRVKLNAVDPQTIRPKRDEPVNVMFVDAGAVEQAVAPDAMELAAAGDDLEIPEQLPPVEAEKEEIDGKADDQAAEQGEVAQGVGGAGGGEDPGVETAQVVE